MAPAARRRSRPSVTGYANSTAAGVLAGLKRQMTDPAVLEEIARRVRSATRAPKARAADQSARIAELQAQVENLADAVASGVLRASPTLAARLVTTELELDRLRAAQADAPRPPADVTRLLADLPARVRRAVDQLEVTLASGDIARARQEIRTHVGTVIVEADDCEIRLLGEHGVEAALLRAAGGAHARSDGSGGRI